MKAEIQELINGYEFVWPAPYCLTARVTRLRIPSDGQVRGELELRHHNGTQDMILLVPTQTNFSSETTRNRYAKNLSEKLDVKIEWREIMDYLSQQVQQLVRAGDALVEVFPDPNATPPEQLLEGLIYRGVQNIIFGEKGVCKSTLAYVLAMCVTLPWHDNPLGLRVPAEGVRVLVLDWETDESIFRYYVSRLQRGMNTPPCSLYYRRCSLPLTDDIEALQRHIEATNAQLLIIDSLGAAAGGERGELKGSESALLFNTALRKLKRTSLIIAQTRKGDDDKRKTIYGSTYFTYYARNILELCAGQDDFGDTQHLALFHRECNLGKKMPSIGLRLTFAEDDGITLERESVSIAEFAEKTTMSTRILELLKDGKMSPKDIREQLGGSYAAISMALKRLARQKKVQKIGNEWGLVAPED